MKPRVGVLTTFYNFDKAYSLCSVVESQLVSLVKYGYNPVLFVHDNFTDDALVPQGVEIRKIVPRFLLVDYSNVETEVTEDFNQQVDLVLASFRQNFGDIDVMIEHDLIFQGWFLPYCVAIHRYADENGMRWLHWTHSVPNLMPKNTKPPHTYRFLLPQHSKLVYLNNVSLIQAAEAYSLFPKDVKIVHNPVDPRLSWNLHPLVHSLIEKYDLLSADFVQTYPVSSTRMVDGKQLNTVTDIFGKIKEFGYSVRIIVCNAHANDKREKQVIAEMLSHASKCGLSANELIFTSLEDAPKYELGVPRDVVSQLFLLSNLFIFPSVSENCPLILLEAMLAKNILILNDDVGAMREFGQDNALYFKFGSIHNTVSYENREKFMKDVALIIISEMRANRPLRANQHLRQRLNYDAIFRRQIEPLFYEQ